MFIIRQKHQETFFSKANTEFACEVGNYLRKNHSGTTVKLENGDYKVEEIADDLLLRLVERGISKARSYGMRWQSTLISFVVIMFVSAPNFDKYKQINEILNDAEEFPEYRINNLWEGTSNETWIEVEKNYDYLEWNY